MARKSTERTRLYGIFSDPWRKLLSIGLGFLLWYYLNRSITETLDSSLVLTFNQSFSKNHIEVKLNSNDFGYTQFVDADNLEKRDEVDIQIKGPKRLIDELKKPGQLAFQVKFTKDAVTKLGNQYYLQFRKEDIHHKTGPGDYDKLLISMSPSTVRAELVLNSNTSLMLTADNVDLDLQGVDAARIQDPKFKPDRLMIYGPRDEINQIDGKTKLFTASITERKIKSALEIGFTLTLAEEWKQKGIRLDAPHVTYKVEPERVRFLLKDVPVVLDTRMVSPEQGADYEVKQKTQDIEIEASGDLGGVLYVHIVHGKEVHDVPASWCKEHARLRVYLRPENIQGENLSRRPTLDLFELDSLDQEKPFRPGPDFIVPERARPVVDIVKRNG